MNRGAALVIALVGGAAVAQFLYMVLGMLVFAALMPFGLDDDLYLADDFSSLLFGALAVGAWAVSSWLIWRALVRRPRP